MKTKLTAVYASVDVEGIDDIDTQAAMTAYKCTSADCGLGTAALSAEEGAEDIRFCIHCGADAKPVKDASNMKTVVRLMAASEDEMVSIRCPKCEHKSVSERAALHRNHRDGDRIRIHCTECGTPMTCKADLIPLPGQDDAGGDAEDTADDNSQGSARAGIFGEGDDVDIEFEDEEDEEDEEETSASGDDGDGKESDAGDSDVDDGEASTTATATASDDDEEDMGEDPDDETEDLDDDEIEASAGEDDDDAGWDDLEASLDDDSAEDASDDEDPGTDDDVQADAGTDTAGAAKNRRRRRQTKEIMDDMDGEGVDDTEDLEDDEEMDDAEASAGQDDGEETAEGDRPMNYIHMGDNAAEISFADADDAVLSRINRVMARFPRLRVTRKPAVRAGCIKMAVSGRKARACMDAMRREFGNIFDYAALEQPDDAGSGIEDSGSDSETAAPIRNMDDVEKNGPSLLARAKKVLSSLVDQLGNFVAGETDPTMMGILAESYADALESLNDTAQVMRVSGSGTKGSKLVKELKNLARIGMSGDEFAGAAGKGGDDASTETADEAAQPEHVADLPAIALVDDEVEASFAHDGETLFCIAGTTCIAALEVDGDTSELEKTLSEQATEHGLRKALEDAGFELVSARVDAGKAVKAEQERLAAEAESESEKALASFDATMGQSLEIAVMGINRGFFVGSGNPLCDNLVDALVTAGVDRREAVEAMSEAFDESADGYAEIVVAKAIEMARKSEDTRNELAATIADIRHKPAPRKDGGDRETSRTDGSDVQDRLERPMRPSKATASASSDSADDKGKGGSVVARWAETSSLGRVGDAAVVDIDAMRSLAERHRRGSRGRA